MKGKCFVSTFYLRNIPTKPPKKNAQKIPPIQKASLALQGNIWTIFAMGLGSWRCKGLKELGLKKGQIGLQFRRFEGGFSDETII